MILKSGKPEQDSSYGPIIIKGIPLLYDLCNIYKCHQNDRRPSIWNPLWSQKLHKVLILYSRHSTIESIATVCFLTFSKPSTESGTQDYWQKSNWRCQQHSPAGFSSLESPEEVLWHHSSNLSTLQIRQQLLREYSTSAETRCVTPNGSNSNGC